MPADRTRARCFAWSSTGGAIPMRQCMPITGVSGWHSALPAIWCLPMSRLRMINSKLLPTCAHLAACS
ncbi:hypothetical protein WJX73_003540 [Symbiochloris irregularis]|uniref:Uncharacterized protein n=1 Tax=Symbiochloris irregularis TaxID=706552 RepID=A0AAW1NUT4_9CHLO